MIILYDSKNQVRKADKTAKDLLDNCINGLNNKYFRKENASNRDRKKWNNNIFRSRYSKVKNLIN